MAEFDFYEQKLHVFPDYKQWQARMYKNYQYDPEFWKLEDRKNSLWEEVINMGAPDVYDTDLWQIRSQAMLYK